MATIIRAMERKDIGRCGRLLCEAMEQNASYISHGELQMGIASSPGELSSDAVWIVPAELAERQGDANSIMLVAEEEEGTVCGFVSCYLETQYGNCYGVLADIVVEHSMRGRGIGRRLVESTLESLLQRAVKSVYLESGLNNQPAHEFFRRCGFETVSQVMRRDLGGAMLA